MIGILDYFFSRFRWYRRLRGGHWELVYVHPPVSRPRCGSARAATRWP